MIKHRWHGLSDEEWITMFDCLPWQSVIRHTLLEIAMSDDACAEDRTAALQTLNIAILYGHLPSDPSFPALTRDVLLLVTMGKKVDGWWKRIGRERRRAVLSDRLHGARSLLTSIASFSAKEPNESHAYDDLSADPTTLPS